MTPSADCMISVQELWKTYEMGAEQVHALRGVNIQIERNEYVDSPKWRSNNRMISGKWVRLNGPARSCFRRLNVSSSRYAPTPAFME